MQNKIDISYSNMVKIAVASHIALDTIDTEDCHLGGAASYCGITCRQLGLDTTLVTKVGADFPLHIRYLLQQKGLEIKEFENCPTTRFLLKLKQQGYEREVYLLAKCNPLSVTDVEDVDVDGWIVSPIIDEVPLHVLKEITKKNKFTILDPQGYIRKVESSGLVSRHRKVTLDLSGISAVKVDEDELSALDSINPEFLISTATRIIRMNQYQIRLNHIDAPDTTGLGDILTAAFACTYLKERDPKWSICCAAGAVKAALETQSMGIDKIPSKSQIEKNALAFFNTI
jgi:sugar/nucleoside kinase (ribokinase family)